MARSLTNLKRVDKLVKIDESYAILNRNLVHLLFIILYHSVNLILRNKLNWKNKRQTKIKEPRVTFEDSKRKMLSKLLKLLQENVLPFLTSNISLLVRIKFQII